MATIQMYCVKGRHKVAVTDPQIVTLKRGRSKVPMRAYKSACPVHGTSMYRFIGKA